MSYKIGELGNFFIHDFETENIPYFGNLSTPHNPENYIVMTGYCIDGGKIEHEYFNNKEESMRSNWADKLLGCRYYVAHNATFEIHWMLKYHREVFLKFIQNGGQVFCTQLAEYMLMHHTVTYPSLEECAVKYGGTEKVDEVKLLWEAGYTTSKIDRALLTRYLADPDVGDVANTRRVCFSQVKLLREQGMWSAFQVRMTSLLFNAVATYNGLYIDMDIANKNLKHQEEQIELLQQSIIKSLPDLPDELQFSFTSPYHLSAFLFGGEVTYDARVSYDPIKYVKVEAYQCADGSWCPITTPIEGLGEDVIRYKSGKNKGLPKVFKVDSQEELLKLGSKTFKFDGLINLEKLPKLVKDEFLGKRAQFRGKQFQKACGTPVYSTSKDALDIIATYTDLAKPLKDLAALVKDTGTFYLKTDKGGKQSGMLQFVEPNGIIHHRLNNTATTTGRLTGSNPNMQQLPRGGSGENDSKVKEMFTSRFGKDGRIVEVDYSALEVVSLAAISGDSNLLRMLTDKIDMHCYRLAAKLNEPYEDVLLKCKDKSHPEYERYDGMRTDIKPRAFSHQYGASAEGIAYSTGCSLEEAVEFKAIEHREFPESNAFPVDVVRPEVEATGMQRKRIAERLDGGSVRMYRRGHFQAKSGNCYSFREHSSWNKEARAYTMDYKATQIANYWNQGEAAFIVQAASGRVIKELIKRDFFGGQVLPVNNVHDAIYLDCATEELAIEAGKLVRDIMESTPKWLTVVIPSLLDWRFDVTPFPAQAEQGVSMAHKESIK